MASDIVSSARREFVILLLRSLLSVRIWLHCLTMLNSGRCGVLLIDDVVFKFDHLFCHTVHFFSGIFDFAEAFGHFILKDLSKA